MSDDESSPSISENTIYNGKLKIARGVVESFHFDSNDFVDLFKRLQNESQTAQAIVFCGYIEDKLVSLMSLHMRSMQKDFRENLFSHNGPLGTFSSRIDMCYALLWITENLKNNLTHIRKIRNRFAHDAYRISVKDSKIESHIKAISVELENILVGVDLALAHEGHPPVTCH